MGVEEVRSQLKRLFYEDKLMEMLDVLNEAGKQHSEHTLSEEELKAVQRMTEVEVLRADVADAERCLELLSDYSLWTKVRDESNIVTYCRDSSTEFLFRGEVVVQCSLFVLIALFSEDDLLPNLYCSPSFTNLRNVSKIQNFTPYRNLAKYVYKLPWPIHDRELVVATCVFPIQESKSCLIVERTPFSSDYLGYPLPDPSPEVVRMYVTTSCINLMFIEDDLTQITLIGSVNPNIVHSTQPLIPATVINYVAKQEVYEIMEKIRQAADNFENSVYQQRVRERSDYYAEVRRELDEYMRLFK